MRETVSAVQVQLNDAFWDQIRNTARVEGIPYQWRALNDELPDTEPSYCMRNFKAAAGKVKAPHGGRVFQDSDVAKWLEAVAHSLKWHPDAELERIADRAIADIAAAQQPDGYLDTYYILNGLENRWTNLTDNHELYCAGHMIEAAVAYFEATGKRVLLDAVIRLVRHIDSVIGAEEGKIHGYPGHPVIEMALMKLYRVTGDPMHLKLAEYFIRQRGQEPLFFREEIEKNRGGNYYWKNGPLGLRYYQADRPLTQQQDAEGHAVRALYLYSGLADVALTTGDETLKESAKRLWDSVNRQLYITGAVGSSPYGEAFTFDYDLPNDTVYGESCASIALVFFAARMLKMELRAAYADEMERALYNGVISGMQLDGKKFFYVNPLEVDPQACRLDAHKRHVKPERQKWFGCACCPPNIIRLLMSLQDYVATAKEDALYIHLYASGSIAWSGKGGRMDVEVETNYPWEGNVTLRIAGVQGKGGRIALRKPGWCDDFEVEVNHAAGAFSMENGYLCLDREWKAGDEITLKLAMPVRLYRASNAVREDMNKLAAARGPVVYCLEEKDNGPDLHLIHVGGVRGGDFQASFRKDLLGGVVCLESPGIREKKDEAGAPLYRDAAPAEGMKTRLFWIPYYAWANRGVGEMRVWINR